MANQDGFVYAKLSHTEGVSVDLYHYPDVNVSQWNVINCDGDLADAQTVLDPEHEHLLGVIRELKSSGFEFIEAMLS